MEQEKTIRICVYGIVQGVGFRPSVDRKAAAHGIRGSVSNKGPFVEILARAPQADLTAFCDDIRHNPPDRAVILKMDIEDSTETVGEGFAIIESEKEQGEIFVSPDIAICSQCKKELYDPSDRRYLHPFINCTSCGPRTTILDGMPYDRVRTSMSEFPMCPQCAYEYTHAETRRYDAQPVCCNACGPQVYILPTDGSAKLPVDVQSLPDAQKDRAAITETRRVIKDGGIVAVKGIGGFHLCCDATNAAAVQRLRDLKPRPVKPFAVMMRDVDTVRRECILTKDQEEILDGHQKPILLLPKRTADDSGQGSGNCALHGSAPVKGNCGDDARANGVLQSGKTYENGLLQSGKAHEKDAPLLAEPVAPGNPAVGVMLPYAPLQLLLFDYDDGIRMPDCLVMTSGNVSGAPICRDDQDAVTELSGMCDLILSHNRLIRLRADDSVMDFLNGEPYMIRRSRGYAPLPFLISGKDGTEPKGSVLAIGGELKNTFCVTRNALFYLSPYIGDLGDVRTVRALTESVTRMEDLLEAKPQLVVCDLHPKYNSVAAAKEMGLPVVQVQHHYAHILSCMAENDYHDRVIGVSFDGTGYGTDGTIWGGEILLSDSDGFTRYGSITPFAHVGGDQASREGWRIAVSMLYGLTKDRACAAKLTEQLALGDVKTAQIIFAMADKGLNTVRSTSAGRLYDAVSAVLGICKASTFEGEASNALMFAAERYEASHPDGTDKSHAAEPPVRTDDFWQLPTDRLFEDLVKAKLAGADSDELAWAFHDRLADMVTGICLQAREDSGLQTAALSGGVFQNRLLTRLCEERLQNEGFRVLLHSMVPPNDGGIALGQALYGMNQLQKGI